MHRSRLPGSLLPFQITQGVEALSPVKLDSVFRKRLEGIRARILLTSFDSGSYQLPHMPLYLKRIDGAVDTLWFSGPDLYVNTIQVDTTSFQAFGLKPQMRYPLTLSEILGAAGILFFLAALVWLIVWIVKRRRKNLPVFGLSRKKDPPHVAALRALDAIKAQELWKKQKVKQYYTLLTDTVRVYMRDRWGIQAMEQTSAEMIASLQRKEADDTCLQTRSYRFLGICCTREIWPSLQSIRHQIRRMKNPCSRQSVLLPRQPYMKMIRKKRKNKRIRYVF